MKTRKNEIDNFKYYRIDENMTLKTKEEFSFLLGGTWIRQPRHNIWIPLGLDKLKPPYKYEET